MCEAFQRVLEKHKDTGVVIDGYSDFLFCTWTGYPKTALNFEDTFRRLAEKYNGCHEEPLPKIFPPHVLGHTFCMNMANAGMNPKALQYIMGHKNNNDAELLRARYIQLCKGRNGAADGLIHGRIYYDSYYFSRQKDVVKSDET